MGILTGILGRTILKDRPIANLVISQLIVPKLEQALNSHTDLTSKQKEKVVEVFETKTSNDQTILNETNQEPWYLSRSNWIMIATGASAGLGLIGYQVSADVVMNILFGIIGVVSLLGMYFRNRKKLTKPIGG